MTNRQMRSYIAVFLIIIAVIYLCFQVRPLVKVFDPTIESFIDESGIVQDSGKFFSN